MLREFKYIYANGDVITNGKKGTNPNKKIKYKTAGKNDVVRKMSSSVYGDSGIFAVPVVVCDDLYECQKKVISFTIIS